MKAAWFPSADTMVSNPYWTLLRAHLQGRGIEVCSANPELGKWMLASRREVQVLHFHFVQQFYTFECTNARLRWVLRLARHLVAARLIGYRTVFTLHDLTPPFPLQPYWVDHLGHWVVANLTDCVIVHGESARRELRERYARRRHVFVTEHPNYIGVYPNTISRDEARARYGLSCDQRVFAFFGSIRPNKGIETLIAAFKQLDDASARLIVIGRANADVGYMQRLISEMATDARIYSEIGFVSDAEIQFCLNAADVIVLPFRWILTSGSAILAMSFGRPVIAPAKGALVDLVRPDSGVLYDSSDPEGLLKALIRCRELDLPALGRSAYQRVEPLSWENLAATTAEAYTAS